MENCVPQKASESSVPQCECVFVCLLLKKSDISKCGVKMSSEKSDFQPSAEDVR